MSRIKAFFIRAQRWVEWLAYATTIVSLTISLVSKKHDMAIVVIGALGVVVVSKAVTRYRNKKKIGADRSAPRINDPDAMLVFPLLTAYMEGRLSIGAMDVEHLHVSLAQQGFQNADSSSRVLRTILQNTMRQVASAIRYECSTIEGLAGHETADLSSEDSVKIASAAIRIKHVSRMVSPASFAQIVRSADEPTQRVVAWLVSQRHMELHYVWLRALQS